MMQAVRHQQRELVDVCEHDGACLFAVGRLLRAYEQTVTFEHDARMAMATADGLRVGLAPGGGSASLTLSSGCLGLTGTVSPLPQTLLAALEQACAEDDGASLAAWLEVVHHRLLSVLHEGVRNAQPSTCATRSAEDAWSRQLLVSSNHAQDVLPPLLRLALGPVLQKPACSAQDIAWSVQTVLRHVVLETQVAVRPMTGGWAPLPDGAACVLGRRNHALGQAFTLGQATLAPGTALDVVLGPVDGPWLAACRRAGAAPRALIAQTLDAVLPQEVIAHVQVMLSPCAATPWQMHPPEAVGALPETSLFGLGAQTHLGSRSAPVAVPWPRALAVVPSSASFRTTTDPVPSPL